MNPPDKKQREVCWTQRDLYFKCLTQNKEDKTKCMETFESFRNACPNSWVEHFIAKRKGEMHQQQVLSMSTRNTDD